MNPVVLPDFLEIRCSPIHGTGVFAAKNIPAGKTIIEYVGRRIDKKESDELCESNNPYVFYIDEDWDIDGSVDWNPARFINHSCNPNCEADQDDDNRVFLHTLRKIKAGEEITYNYGYDLEYFEEYPCKCGARNCIGFMVAEEHWDAVRRARRRKSSRTKRRTPVSSR